MSFNLHRALRWLRAGKQTVTLRRADGAAWTDEMVLSACDLDGAVLDSRQATSTDLFVGVAGEHTHGGQHLQEALERGAPAALIEGEFVPLGGWRAPIFVVEDGRKALAALARGWLEHHQPIVVGITGSNGKTTTKDLVAAALASRHRVGASPGNLNSSWGLPLAILRQRGNEDVLVLEMGASAPGEIASLSAMLRPRIGCVTNVAPAHLEGFGTLDAVVRTKGELLESLPAAGVSILNRDDDHYAQLRALSRAQRTVSFGRGEEADVRLQECEQEIDGLRLRIAGEGAHLPLFGRANGMNAAAAVAIAGQLDLGVREALDNLVQAHFSPHRSRLLHCAGRIVLDDCYNANPASMRESLDSLIVLPNEGRRIAVLGSMAELGEDSPRLHLELLDRAFTMPLDRVVVCGAALARAARERGLEAEIWPQETASEMRRLGGELAVESAPGDALLLKASRSAALENALESLLEVLEEKEGGG